MRCPHCGRDSDPLFKFCLHCGRELSGMVEKTPLAKAVPKPAPPEPEPPAEPAPEPLVDPVVESVPAPEPVPEPAPEPVPEPVHEPVPEEPVPEPVADEGSQSDAEPEVDVEGSETGTADVAEDDTAQGFDDAEPDTPVRQRCPRCGARLTEAGDICQYCGLQLASEQEVRAMEERVAPEDTEGASPHPASRALVANLISIDTTNGTEAARIPIYEGKNTLGRRGCDITFSEDDLLSPHHLTIDVKDNGDVELLSPVTLNGTYLRIDSQTPLVHGNQFRVGQQLLRFEEMRLVEPVVDPNEEGTRVLGSPTPSVVWGRLVQVVTPTQTASAFLLTGEQVRIGREKGSITFPGDRYMSANHAMVLRRSDGYFIQDAGSSNGTYVRVGSQANVNTGQYFLAGRQLFRMEQV
jgi:pSer/pThr/pTyr-binding forkhead associated (FHA) protein